MPISHKVSYGLSSSSSAGLSGAQNEAGNTEIVQDVLYAANLTNQLLAVSFTQSALQSVMLVSDKGLTIKTNSSGSPQETIVLKPGIPLCWGVSAGYFACPFAGNVTAFYVTTTASSRLQVKILTA